MTTTLLNNRYQILHTIGRGGFGETFLAIDTHMPSARKCVIKQLKPLMQEQGIEDWVKDRFKREAVILEELGENNPQIPRLYAYFSEGSNFYLVQELIAGLNLKQRKEKQELFPENRVKAILVNLLPVLDYIHSKKIVHRDIKPDNIIIRASDEKPVLIDFGVVKEAMATVVHTQGNSVYSMGIGTPGYMPSEQAAGRPVYSSDLYSLGLTAIFLLTGKSPQYLQTDPRTGEFIWRDRVPNLHSHLAMVLEKAVRFHPRDRFASAREMLAALQTETIKTTAATVAVSPGYSNVATQTRTRTEVVKKPTATYSSTKTPSQNGNWLFTVLLILGLVTGGAFALGFNLFTPQKRVPSLSSSSQSDGDNLSSVFSSPIPTPEEIKPAKVQATPEAIVPEEEQPEVKETPEVEEQPEVEETPIPELIPSPSREAKKNIPIFTFGSKEDQIIQTLGKPTFISRGYWPNSRAIFYQNFIPKQVDLGYLVDSNTKKLRQTEVFFASSVELKVMQNTLKKLLAGNVPPGAKQGLEEIYNRQNDLRSFNTGKLKGMIQRNYSDRIYITIWESDFH